MLVKCSSSAVDGSDVDSNFNRTLFGCTIKLNLAFFFVKATTVGCCAEMANFKSGKGVCAVDDIRCCLYSL